ncbi:uncharacterized protein si:dkey-6e2.2 [Synchiropus splendidus]|uniref:uncharacterized protein si:dkey-6e2.2 n=1 Tax=Synchiropus splendidus TaxID=270530 RepID=UPI00237D37A8|nr:uncharacterized protein si:dkey-6e2.2 [Synchiropus splendidus]
MNTHWQDREIRELVAIRARDEVKRQISGTVRYTVLYGYIARMLKDRGFVRAQKQVINKLKSLKKKCMTINDKMGPVATPHIGTPRGNSASPSTSLEENPVPQTCPLDVFICDGGRDADGTVETPASDAEVTDCSSQADSSAGPAEDGLESPSQAPQVLPVLPRKRKRSREDHTAALFGKVMAELKEMDKTAAEREDARLKLFMAHEIHLWESQ